MSIYLSVSNQSASLRKYFRELTFNTFVMQYAVYVYELIHFSVETINFSYT